MSQHKEQVEELPKPIELSKYSVREENTHRHNEETYLYDIALSLRRIAKTFEIQVKK